MLLGITFAHFTAREFHRKNHVSNVSAAPGFPHSPESPIRRLCHGAGSAPRLLVSPSLHHAGQAAGGTGAFDLGAVLNTGAPPALLGEQA